MKNLKLYFNFGVLLFLAFLSSCQKEVKSALPTVVTDSVTNVLSNAATIYSKVTGDGSSSITARGVCWKTSSNPTITDNKTSDGTALGVYTSNISGLTPNTIYYVKAYTTNSVGTSYGAEISFTTQIENVLIGTQKWTLKNLNVATYKNGDIIPQVTDSTQWANLTTGAWCYYKNDPANEAVYGKLYNWYAVNDSRGIAPAGWHIPTKEEFITLTAFLGGDNIAGGKMKATTLWANPNTGATNESGFTGLPAGLRGGDASFVNFSKIGWFWTSKEHDATTGVERNLQFDISDCYMFYIGKGCGLSVRCVKD